MIADQSQRDVTNGSEILCHYLPDQPVSSGCADCENAIVICKTDCGTVDLQLNSVAGFLDVIACEANDSLFPCGKLVVVERIAE